MKVFILTLQLIFVFTFSQAQDLCYKKLMKEGLRNFENLEYDKAINFYLAALNCPDRPSFESDELPKLIKLTLNAKILELKRAQIKIEEEKKKTSQALQEKQKMAKNAVTLLLTQADEQILKLNYNAAQIIINTAWNLDEKREDVLQRLQEIAFFFTESNQYTKAVDVLSTIDETVHKERLQLLEFIKNLDPNFFNDVLIPRYYPEMIFVAGGTFIMGCESKNYSDCKADEQPSHPVNVSDFWIGRTEISVWQFYIYTQKRRLQMPKSPTWQWHGNHPMIYISWNDTQSYTKWLSLQQDTLKLFGYLSKYYTTNEKQLQSTFRLPTEAEWEYAAKGGQKGLLSATPYAGSRKLSMVAWWSKNSSRKTQAIAQKQPNELGLYDMSGNVWEWCWDGYDPNYYAKKSTTKQDPKGPFVFSDRILRGGSWYSDNSSSRVTFRLHANPGHRDNFDFGFRVAL